MTKKFTHNTAVNFQGMEQRTAHLQDSLSLNLFDKLKGISFVILLGVSMNLYSQDDNAIWDAGLGIAVPDADFQKFPPFTILPSSQPTYRIGFGLPPTADAIPLYVEGNIGTNHSFAGTIGTVGGIARWNAIGDRVPIGALPYISTTGFRSTWENWGMNVGMSQTYSGVGRDALISWQDATVLNPLLASNRLVFGVRDSSTTHFEEVAQIATNNGTLFGIGIVDPNNPFVPEEQLHLYNFRTPPDTSPLPLYQKWSNDFNPVGSRIGYPGGANVNFQIRQEENASIEFWTNNNPQVYINEQGGNSFLGIVTATVIPFMSTPLNTTTPTGALIVFFADGTGAFKGDLPIEGAYFQASDERLKESFQNLQTDWKKILNISPYSYSFKVSDEFNFSKTKSYGFKTQEIKQYIPELVTHNGKFHLVNYNGLIPFLTQGIQEHETRIEALEQNVTKEKDAEIERLRNENNELKNRIASIEEQLSKICNLPCFQNDAESIKNSTINTGKLEDALLLEQNEPNPFNQTTIIRYYIPESAQRTNIVVKNMDGKTVGNFNITEKGYGTIQVNSGLLSAGSFYYSLIIDGSVIDTKKMILAK
jgi:hypothetical protein